MSVDGSIQVIVNASAGSADDAVFLDQLQKLVNGDPRWRISVAKTGAELSSLVKNAAEGSSQIVVAAGGDGTVHTVANSLVGTTKILGVLPVGTLNHFARDLKIPLDLEDAIATISGGLSIKIDTGEVNGKVFINNSSLGLYPHIVTQRQRYQSLGAGKWSAFVWAAWSVLKRYPFVDVRLTLDGMSFKRRTPLVFIGNNRYEMEGLRIGARSCLSAGQLSLYTTNRRSRLGLFILGIRALVGRLRADSDFVEVCTREIWMDTKRRRVRVALDGEVTVLTPPLHYRILPQSLRVMVPRPVS
jgi:diacylglycerol kinase family enzyme